MKLSIVIPAFNEAKVLPECLASIEKAVRSVLETEKTGHNFEVETIVTDNNSTDGTALLAEVAGARIVFEPINQISRARNAGAAVANGDWLLFMDADSRLHTRTLRELIYTIRLGGCAGGGCVVDLDPIPWWAVGLLHLWNRISRSMKWAAGSFLFCRANAFADLGGFDEQLYAAEDIELSRRLKSWARSQNMHVHILTDHPHMSSGRKFELYTKWEILILGFRTLCWPVRTVRHRARLGYFYDSRR